MSSQRQFPDGLEEEVLRDLAWVIHEQDDRSFHDILSSVRRTMATTFQDTGQDLSTKDGGNMSLPRDSDSLSEEALKAAKGPTASCLEIVLAADGSDHAKSTGKRKGRIISMFKRLFCFA